MARQRANNLGSIAENFAAGLLLRNGYKIIEKNFKSRYGEIDIIAVKDGFLVFIEVKARSGTKFGLPEEAVTTSKLNKIERTGEYYSLTHPEASKKNKD